MPDQQFSLRAQIEEVEREIALREKVYPAWVRSGKMRQSVADYHMARMRAVLATLAALTESLEAAGRMPKLAMGDVEGSA